MRKLQLICLLLALLLPAGLSAQVPVRIVAPNGGEQLRGGRTTEIRWIGVAPQDSVRLEYSTDAGTSWKLIVDAVGGSSYMWRVPSTLSSRVLVRAEQVTGNFGRGDSLMEIKSPVRDGLVHVAYSRDGNFLLTTGKAYLEIWNAWTGELVRRITHMGDAFGMAEFNRDGSLVVSADVGHIRVVVWDLSSGDSVGSFISRGFSVAISNVGSYVACSSWEAKSWYWNLSSRTLIDSFPGGTVKSNNVQFSSNDSLLLFGGSNSSGKVLLYEIASKKLLLSLTGNYWSEFGPDESLIVASSSDYARIYDRTREMYTDSVRSIVRKSEFAGARFHPDGRHLAVWSDAVDTIPLYRIYNGARSPEQYLKITNDTNVHKIAFSPDGSRLAVGLRDGRTIIWGIQRRDQSDTTFSIGGPVADAPDLDLGRRAVGQSFDTTVAPLVRNVGSADLNIDAVRLIRGDMADFALTSGTAPFVLPVGSGHDISLNFRPGIIGKRSVTLELAGPDDTVRLEIEGEGISGSAELGVQKIIFPQTVVSNTRDTTIDNLLHNIGAQPLQVDSVRIGGTDAEMFEVIAGGDPGDVAVGTWRGMTIRYRPTRSGGAKGQLMIAYGSGEVARVELEGTGQPAGVEEKGEDLSREGRVRVMPNPAGSVARVEYSSPGRGRVSMEIVDMLGRVVLKQQWEAAAGQGSIEIDLAILPPGAYEILLHGSSMDQTIGHGRFIHQ